MLKLSDRDLTEDRDRYIYKAMNLLHSPETTQQVQKQLASGDPLKQLATVTVMLMRRIDSAVRKAGMETKDGVKIVAMQNIVGLVAELAAKKGIFKLDPNYIVLAFAIAIQEYFKGEIQSGRIDPNKFRASIGEGLKSLPPEMQKKTQMVSNQIPQIAKQYAAQKSGMKGV